MNNWDRLNKEMLPNIEEKLGKIRNLLEGERYDALTDMLAYVSLSPNEKLKLRRRMKAEFHYPSEDFDQVFGSQFSLNLWEKVGRGN